MASARNWTSSAPRPRGRTTSTSSATRSPNRMRSANDRWHAALTPVFHASTGLDPNAISTGPGRLPFSHQAAERAGGVPAGGRQLPFRPARRRSAGAGAGLRGEDPVVGDDRRGGPLAGGARRGCDHRAGPRGGRTSRDVPVGRSQHADGHARTGAADRPRGARAGDRRRRHRRRRGRCSRDGTRRGWRADRDGVPVVPRSHDQRRSTARR